MQNLENVNSFIENFLEKSNCSAKLIDKILISCEEIFINICNYAYNGEAKSVFLDIRLNMGKIVIEFQDFGIPFDPTSYVSKKSDRTKKIGGLGIFLVKNLMDELKYSRVDGKNIVTIIKKVEG